MDHLKPTQLTTLRGLLTQRLRTLRGEVDAAETGRRADASAAAHEVTDRKDEASAQQLAEVDSAQEARDLNEMAKVEAALLRLNTGAYGQCMDCGEPIVLPRLMVEPAAQRCAHCQLLRERDEARSH